ncbi:uncharacterized protein BX663DRAFT_519651 [Cokeromyces recurvatus]|uniref:uncharacterized protein n=1 Tax=Cokeromyces recurvatus TaxID=90255 RepID=UPI00221FFFA1|nr:uncharacterized protein BX663DRAFT_519651 [Cokeromyces recurvatus]KAI7899830.1 hypothetical protein BX663DRAFT_519651 [Cokeromyces recurvatus]
MKAYGTFIHSGKGSVISLRLQKLFISFCYILVHASFSSKKKRLYLFVFEDSLLPVSIINLTSYSIFLL